MSQERGREHAASIPGRHDRANVDALPPLRPRGQPGLLQRLTPSKPCLGENGLLRESGQNG